MDTPLRLVEAAIVLAREGHLPGGLVEGELEKVRPIGDLQLLAPLLGQAAALFHTVGQRMPLPA